MREGRMESTLAVGDGESATHAGIPSIAPDLSAAPWARAGAWRR
jgi:hypothetical protein